jgi:hypothetical protein
VLAVVDCSCAAPPPFLSPRSIVASWLEDEEAFEKLRAPYLLYDS